MRGELLAGAASRYGIGSPTSIESEPNFDTNLHVYRTTILEGGLEFPLLHSLDGLRIQSHSQAAYHANVAGTPLIINNQPEDACSLSLGITRFLCIFRIWR